MPETVRRFKKVLAGKEPDIDTGDHCHKPYDCPYIGYCSGPRAKYPVEWLRGSKKVIKELICDGIDDIRDIPAGRLSSKKQKWVRDVTISGKPDLKTEAAKILSACPYPRYYLDFETIQFAVPIWKDTRPYQALQFQWSCHVETESGELTHKEFLDTSGDAPMRAFIETLLEAVGKRGPIFVYNHHEKTQLKDLIARFPDLKSDIEKVIVRLVDLLPLTRKYYCHPDMRGSWSIKDVLPTIAPDLDYSDLGEVQDGAAAGIAYLEIIHTDTDPTRAQTLATDLREYCKRDTEALIALAHFLSTGKIQRKNHA